MFTHPLVKHEFTRIISRIYPVRNWIYLIFVSNGVSTNKGRSVFKDVITLSAAIRVFLSVIICVGLLLINLSTYQPINRLFAQEIDVKTKIKELKHKDPKVRISAIQSLGKVQNEEIVRALTDAYKKEKDAYLRMQMVDSLSVNQSTTALTSVIFALDDPNPQVRQSAVIALGYYGDNEKIASALSLLFDKEKEEAVKFSIINTIGQQKNKTAVETLGKVLKTENEKRIRLFTVNNLEKIDTKEAFEKLEKNKPIFCIRNAKYVWRQPTILWAGLTQPVKDGLSATPRRRRGSALAGPRAGYFLLMQKIG